MLKGSDITNKLRNINENRFGNFLMGAANIVGQASGDIRKIVMSGSGKKGKGRPEGIGGLYKRGILTPTDKYGYKQQWSPQRNMMFMNTLLRAGLVGLDSLSNYLRSRKPTNISPATGTPTNIKPQTPPIFSKIMNTVNQLRGSNRQRTTFRRVGVPEEDPNYMLPDNSGSIIKRPPNGNIIPRR